MINKEVIIKKIAALLDADLQRVAEFLSSLEERPDARKREADALSGLVSICEGPQDLAEKHDSYAAPSVFGEQVLMISRQGRISPKGNTTTLLVPKP